MKLTNNLIDFRKDQTYKATTKPQIIDVPTMLFVTVDGRGAPESSTGTNTEFQEAMQAIFGIVYTIKFWDKKFTPPTGYTKFTMAPLEALWWMKDNTTFDASRSADWCWTVMVRLPDFVTPEYFAAVVTELVNKKQSTVYQRAQLSHFSEGTCVQILHLGPYDKEKTSIDTMLEFAQQQGYTASGKHHELYFSDPRRTAPEKLRTILRCPIKKQSQRNQQPDLNK